MECSIPLFPGEVWSSVWHCEFSAALVASKLDLCILVLYEAIEQFEIFGMSADYR